MGEKAGLFEGLRARLRGRGPTPLEPTSAEGDDPAAWLLKAFEARSAKRRVQVAFALGKTGDCRALEPLLRHALWDRDARVRGASAYALAGTDDPLEAFARVNRLVHRETEHPQAPLAGATGREPVPLLDALRGLPEAAGAAERAVAAAGKLAGALIASPLVKERVLVDRATCMLSQWQDARVVDPLLSLLNNSRLMWLNPTAGMAAARALKNHPDPRVAEGLARLLVSSQMPWELRREVENTLAAQGPAAGEPLLRLLAEGQPDVRRASAALLGRLNYPEHVEFLAAALADPVLRVREEAAWALAGMGTPGILALLRALHGYMLERRQIHDQALPHLLAAASRCLTDLQPLPHRSAQIIITSALWRIPAGALGKAILEPLSAGDLTVSPAIEVIATRRGHRNRISGAWLAMEMSIADRLMDVLLHPAAWARVWAAETLGKMRRPELLGRLAALLSHPNPETALAAAVALGHHGDARGLDLLRCGLRGPLPEVRIAAAEALGALGSAGRPALPELDQTAVEDPKPWVQIACRAAAQAIRQALGGGPTELEAADAPAGRGTEPEASTP